MQHDMREREAMVAIGRLMHKNRYVTATDGNISVRKTPHRIIVTPSGVSKGFMNADELIAIDPTGHQISGKLKPSSEIKLHLKIYERRPDVNAVIHAHPPLCTALTIAGISMAEPVVPEIVLSLGSIPTAAYATPTTDEVPRSIEPFIAHHDAILLERHGIVTAGATLEAAFNNLEKVENTALIMLTAHLFGKMNPLSAEQIATLMSIRERYGH